MKKIRFISVFICIIISLVIFSGTAMADEPAYEARIGSTYYKTLEDAFSTVQSPDPIIITLLCDVTDITSTITVNGGCTLDMNGFDITGSCTVFHVTTLGGLTLVDLTDSGSSLTSTSGDCTVLSDWFYRQWNVDVISETGAAIINNVDNINYADSCMIFSGTARGKTYGVYSKEYFRLYGGTVTGGTAYYFSEAGKAPSGPNIVITVSEDGKTATAVGYENTTAFYDRYLPKNISFIICFDTLGGAIGYCPSVFVEDEVKLILLHDIDMDKERPADPKIINPKYEGSWTIDLNGHNITGSGTVIDNFFRSNLTITNSSEKQSQIICSSDKVPVITNKGGLTLENVTVSGGSCGVRLIKDTYLKAPSPVLTLNNASIACKNGSGIEYVNGTVKLITGTISGTPYAACGADGSFWNGYTLGENSGYKVNTDTTVTASFKHSLKVLAGNGGSITTDVSENYVESAEINISASPKPGYYFVGWTSSGGGAFEDANSESTVFTMPNSAATVTANFAKITYSLKITAGTGGSITTGSSAYYSEGAEINLSASPDAGYYFNGWTSSSGGTFENANSTSTTFTMPDSAATVTANFAQISSGDSDITYYTISATAGTGGSISPSGIISVAAGASKKFTITPNDGYIISDVLVDGVSAGTAGIYTFENVKKVHIIKAVFEKTKSTVQWENPYADVRDKAWYFDAVRLVSEKGLMVGTSSSAFSPNGGMTRGMFVTVLYRLSGDTGSYSGSFTDVPSGEWYKNAVAWAAQNDIVGGVGDNKFAPDAGITREQLAVILYNFAKYKGYDVSVEEDTNILSYKDARSILEYAYAALQWACGAGIINGDDNGYLNPNGPATRAEVAAMLQRFVENVIG